MNAKRMKRNVIPTLCDLPDEMLMNIFSLLAGRDLRAIGLICNRFQKVIDRLKMERNFVLDITEKNAPKIKVSLEINNCKLNFRRIKIENVTSLEDLKYIFQSIGKQVEHLSIKNTAAFDILKSNVTNLKSLELHFDNVLESNLNKKTFDLRIFPFLDNLVLIKNLCWKNTKLVLDQLKGTKAILSLKHFKLECLAENERDLIVALLHHADTLETLDIHFHKNLLNWKNLLSRLKNVKKLRFSGNVNQEMLNNFNFMPKANLLEHLEINSRTCKITDEILISLIPRWINSLQYIELSCCDNLSDVNITELRHFVNLRFLKLSNCIKVTKTGILMGIALETNPYMEELELENIPYLDELGLRVMVSRFPNLRVLKLNNLVESITNISLASIFRYLTHLRILSINYCFNITDEGVIGFGRNAYSIKRLRLLEELSLDKCRKLTDQALINGLQLPNLGSLTIGSCHKITLKGIEALVKGCPLLVNLSIPSTAMTNGNALFVIGYGLKHLKQLIITDCEILPDNVRTSIQDSFRADHMKPTHISVFAHDCKLAMIH